jgi:hypothetical protein
MSSFFVHFFVALFVAGITETSSSSSFSLERQNDRSSYDHGVLPLSDDRNNKDDEECVTKAYFSVFKQTKSTSEEERKFISCEKVIENDRMKCVLAVETVICRLERSKAESRFKRKKCSSSSSPSLKSVYSHSRESCERCVLKTVGSSTNDDDEYDKTNNKYDVKRNTVKRNSVFKFLFHDDDDENDADDAEEEEEENEKKFYVTKETELQMYFQALSRVERECQHAEHRFRQKKAQDQLNEMFKRIEKNEEEARESIEKALRSFREMESEISISIENTLRQAANVQNQTHTKLSLTLEKVKEAQNTIDKLTVNFELFKEFAQANAYRLKEISSYIKSTKSLLSKSSLVLFLTIWFMFGTRFVPFIKEGIRQIILGILVSHLIEIFFVPRLVSAEYFSYYFRTNNENDSIDIDIIDNAIASTTQFTRVSVFLFFLSRNISIFFSRMREQKRSRLKQDALESALENIERNLSTLLKKTVIAIAETTTRTMMTTASLLAPTEEEEKGEEEESESQCTRRSSKRLERRQEQQMMISMKKTGRGRGRTVIAEIEKIEEEEEEEEVHKKKKKKRKKKNDCDCDGDEY